MSKVTGIRVVSLPRKIRAYLLKLTKRLAAGRHVTQNDDGRALWLIEHGLVGEGPPTEQIGVFAMGFGKLYVTEEGLKFIDPRLAAKYLLGGR